MTIRVPILFLAAALASAVAAPARAQDSVRVAGGDRSRATALIQQVLARRNYLRLDRDTVLPKDFHATGDLVVYDADVRLEGTVDGSVAVLGGDFFIRPGARVGGSIGVVGGGVYTSELATTGEILESEPGTRVVLSGDSLGVEQVDEDALGAEIIPPERPSVVALSPRLPTYDRVNGLTLALGASFYPQRDHDATRFDAWVSYRGENPDHVGGGARADVPLGAQGLRLVGEASRETRTQDRWLRGDLANSLAVAAYGKDYRNYYDADRASLTLTRPVGEPLVPGESWLSPHVGVQWEDARSLATRDVWSIWEDDQKGRVNPAIDEGTLVSVLAGTGLEIVGGMSNFEGDLTVEHGFSGDVESFTQATVWGKYEATTFRTHTLRMYFRGMAPLGGDGAPPQRFGILGGGGTLPTIDIGDFRGDHLAFVESSYSIPFYDILLPLIGTPALEFFHAAGAAWETGDDMPPWVQNVGVGVAFQLFSARVLIDPAEDPIEPKFSFKISVPFR